MLKQWRLFFTAVLLGSLRGTLETYYSQAPDQGTTLLLVLLLSARVFTVAIKRTTVQMISATILDVLILQVLPRARTRILRLVGNEMETNLRLCIPLSCRCFTSSYYPSLECIGSSAANFFGYLTSNSWSQERG